MKKASTGILLFIINFMPAVILGQDIFFQAYTVQDGLVANPVRCIYQDSKGFIWIGTYEGLSRYDGYKFINYTSSNGLSHNLINTVIEVDGKLLIGENNGAVDVVQNNSIKKGFMLYSAVNKIIPYQKRILITTDYNGFYEYKKDTIIHPVQESTGTSLGHFIAINDSLLICDGVDNNLIIYKNDLTIHSTRKNFNTHFSSLFQDSKQRIWALTSNGLKLIRIPTAKNKQVSFISLPSTFNLPFLNSVHVTSMIEVKDGSFWIGTMKGLIHLYPDGNFHIYNERDGLPSAMIYALYNDKENNLWIGTSLGLAKWVSRNNVVFYNTENKEFKNDVISIMLNDKNVIVRTAHGLQLFHPDTKEFEDIKSAGKNYFTPVSGSSPQLVYFEGNLGTYDSEKNIISSIEKLDITISGVIFACRHPDGTVFLGTFGGLFVIKKTLVKKILPYRITSLVISKDGNVWAGTWGSGLFRIIVNNDLNAIPAVQNMTSIIKKTQIRGLFVDKNNNIWVGTRYDGAYCLSEKVKGQFQILHYNRQSGLMSDWINSFAETKTGDMWVGTYLGLDKLIRESSGYRVFNFSKAVNFFAEIKDIVATSDDEWLCVANTGIASFRDESIDQTTPLQPIIFSTSLGIYENKQTVILPTEKIYLKPNQNAARFEFGALGFINERQILYSYRLKGSSDTTWSKPENIHEASYASLSPGEYTFEVKTLGWNGKYSKPIYFEFFIRTPFWKQWWFIGLCVLAVAAFFYALYQYRIRQFLRLQKVRNNIATDLHDDIGSTLTIISILSELSSKNLGDTKLAGKYLERITEEVNASGQALDDIIWNINSNNDSLEDMIIRMRRFAAELFDHTQTLCQLQLQPGSSSIKIGMEQRRDVYLLYKEALNNVYKHAQAKNVKIILSMQKQLLKLRIEDNGKGFDINAASQRNGLKNMKARVDKWKGSINFFSEPGKGTHTHITIPLT